MSVWVALAVLAAAPASAEVVISVDRPSVDLNESFELRIFVDSNIDMEPDLTPLDAEFYRGQATHLSNTSIINGQINRSRTWTVPLMAKSTGRKTIPAIKVGSETSEPLDIMINEPSAAPPGEADVFVTSEVDQTEAYVQSQILYRIKVYRAVQTRQPALRDMQATGAETLIESVGDDRSYSAVLNGREYVVIERVFALYPQESGEISIAPARFEARVLRDGRITGRKVFDSEAHTVTVLPMPLLPPEHAGAAWLPARDLRISEEWSREPGEIEAGEPVTRRVTISALGQLETQIPALDPPEIDGMNVYADKPELGRSIEADGIRGVRKDQYAMIGTRGGSVDVPALEIPWFDIEAKEWRVATLPARTVIVEAPSGVPDPEPVEPVPAEEEESAAAEEEPAPMDGVDRFWKLATQLMAAIWLLTLLAWWWSSRAAGTDRKQEREPGPQPVYRLQAKFVKAAKDAAAAGDATELRSAILEWGRLQWPGNAPRSIGEFAERVTDPLASELRRLSAASYGRNGADWDGKTIARSLGSVVLIEDQKKAEAGDPLPPLMPSRG